MGASLIAVLISKLPEIIALSKEWFGQAHPELPEPTSEEVIAAWIHASTSSLLKDEAWLAAHPEGDNG